MKGGIEWEKYFQVKKDLDFLDYICKKSRIFYISFSIAYFIFLIFFKFSLVYRFRSTIPKSIIYFSIIAFSGGVFGVLLSKAELICIKEINRIINKKYKEYLRYHMKLWDNLTTGFICIYACMIVDTEFIYYVGVITIPLAMFLFYRSFKIKKKKDLLKCTLIENSYKEEK